MPDQKLNNDEREVVLYLGRYLSEYQRNATAIVEFNDVPLPGNRDIHWLKDFTERLRENELVDGYYNTGMVLLPSLKRMSDSLETHPTPDYWKSTKAWWFSKLWSVPVMVALNAFTSIVGVIAILKVMLEWLGVSYPDGR